MSNFSISTAIPESSWPTSLVAILFRKYCEPVFCLISLLGNSAVIIGMARVKQGLSKSVRFYYIVYAISELLLVDGFFFTGDFLEVGIAYLVSDGKFFPILTVDGTVWSCKLLLSLWLGSDCVAGFTLVCLGFERIIAVTWPLRAKAILTLRFSVIIEATLILLSAIYLPLVVITYTIDQNYGCTYDFSLPFTQYFIYIEEAIPIINSFLSLSFSTYLIIKMVLLIRARRRISSGGVISALELSNIATLVLLDVTRLVVYIPNGIVYIFLSFANLSSIAIDGGFMFVLYQLADLCSIFIQVPHSITFFIHFFRSGAFRKVLFGEFFEFLNGKSSKN